MSESVVPSFDSVKSVAVIAAACIGAYVLYRMYTAGNSIAATVKETITNAKNAVVVDSNKLRTTLGGATPPPLEDQSSAESERLGRQNGPQLGWFGDEIIGLYSPSSAQPQTSSPDAIGTVVYDAMGNPAGYTGGDGEAAP